ncbi:tripartite tricarboxylate transporter substrate binding protein [Bosea sp. TND4EK4]|uniref:Bug family tripartite tricarboxylate transporter substrate binding protein n=1 Tax=Bosea sp. TND4EK4 TaxID=1907408 RepID=UPI000955FBA7|nr:tripartite tricarboxylate transporter substrate binding protein [Bosea sp. TND4EK4]SIR27680.1 Tripartite-type tricarboxylate transporter, receptor component TctC [Bosea sp. TND4EK4]
MTLTRRNFSIHLGSLCAASMAGSVQAQQPYPSRPITVVVPSGAGGLSDTLARIVTEKAKADLGAAFVIENKPGASGIIAASGVKRAQADGYTVLLANGTSNGAAEALAAKPPYDSIKDFVPVAHVGETQLALVASKKLPVKTAQELLAYARAHPGKLTYGSFGHGSAGHLFGEVMKKENDISMVHVPYKNEADVVQAMIAGEIDLGMLVSAKPFVDEGQVTLFGVTSPSGTAAYPGWPSLSSQGVRGFSNARGFQIFLAPAGTPEPVLKKLGAALTRAISDPVVGKRTLDLGVAPANTPEAEMQTTYRELVEQWRALVKASNVQTH